MQSEVQPTSPPLNLGQIFEGKSLLVVGGTGFLGKVWLAMMLSRFSGLSHIYLMVREKPGLSAHERFVQKIIGSEVFHPLRQEKGDAFEDFINQRVTPISGDISQPMGGVEFELRDQIRGEIAAVINVAGIVDFDPPLDEALQVNAFGCQNLVALAKDLGDCPILHTSTCFTAGSRTGPIEELDPREIPFPRSGELPQSDWSPEREIAECLDVIEQARHRAGDAFRQTRFHDQARQNLKEAAEPASGPVFEEELAKVRRKFVEKQLSELGMERAQFWGWPNTYTYTKSIGEQIVASSGLPFTIVRPAIVESTMEFPFPGWNEGINTSAPIIFLIRQGGLQVPGSNNNLDMIPCDMVCAGIIMALGELIEGRGRPVYQAGSSDRNPCTMRRFFELSGLHKRAHYRETQKGGPVLSELQRRYESALLTKKEYRSYGPHKLARGAEFASGFLKKAGRGPLSEIAGGARRGLDGFAKMQRRLGRIMDIFLPFVAEYQYIFKTDALYAAYERLSAEEQALLPWGPDRINWREWFLEVHAPALERHVFPLMEERMKRQKQPPRPHQSLTTMLDDMGERFDLKIALCRLEAAGQTRLSYRGLRDESRAVGQTLCDRGVEPGDRVLLIGKNHPAWALSFFGILYAGATVVPLDASIEPAAALRIAQVSRARFLICDAQSAEEHSELLPEERLLFATLGAASKGGKAGQLKTKPMFPELPGSAPADLAALIYTSGTTGTPKGVMLSHHNLTSLIASLAPLFPLGSRDRLLSVLPLHHTFELSCGLLLPLSRGARVTYLDELNAERLGFALEEVRATAMIGVPALWEMLERRIQAKVGDAGGIAERGFDLGIEFSRFISKHTGVDVGRALFGSVHAGLGGHLKYLVSGGAALPQQTHQFFQGLGLHLSEGYGLTEAGPVLAVALGKAGAKPGNVGKALSGVELRIAHPNPDGVGEVLARGPNIMQGYADNQEATAQALDAEGWLHTGDLGKLDHRGRLTLVGRNKDVIVAANGENIYPDDLEARLGEIEGIEEFSLLGVSDKKGGERLAAALHVAAGEGERAEAHQVARDAWSAALKEFPHYQKPGTVVIFDEKLPRTTTRKVKRGELRLRIENLGTQVQSSVQKLDVDSSSKAIVEALAKVVRKQPTEIESRQHLLGDLGLDSLMALELLVSLETRFLTSLDAEKLAQAETVAEFVEAVQRQLNRRKSVTNRIEKESGSEDFSWPEPLRQAAMGWLGKSQRSFYERVLQVKVTGSVFIPQNRNSLIVANHTSHLDQGLVKYALGQYGDQMSTLAAADYFFEGSDFQKRFFRDFTHLVPMPRQGSLRAALRAAGEVLERGTTVLIFPEGTRGSDGQVREFKPAMGHLALRHEVDILPMYLEGAARVLPKGAKVLKGRKLGVKIGPPLLVKELKQLTAGLSAGEASRIVTRIAQLAVTALKNGTALHLNEVDIEALRRSESPQEVGMRPVIEELGRRYLSGEVEKPLTYYFSLGEERWTVRVTPAEIEIAQGKTSNSADCVLKTSPEVFEKIIRQAWVPTPQSFVSGEIKTSNINHLMKMQKIFQLTVRSEDLPSNLGTEGLGTGQPSL